MTPCFACGMAERPARLGLSDRGLALLAVRFGRCGRVGRRPEDALVSDHLYELAPTTVSSEGQ